MVLYIQKYGMQTMNIMKQEKRASLPGGARRFGFVCSFSFEMFWAVSYTQQTLPTIHLV